MPSIVNLLDLIDVIHEARTPYANTNRPAGIHAHMCGYDHEDRNRADDGCGFVWAHDGRTTQAVKDSKEYDRLHTCPRCGAGPWRSVKYTDIVSLYNLFESTKDVHNVKA